jgi:4-diphosphocytidyl-2-C-methyl-D-erythritol kinase
VVKSLRLFAPAKVNLYLAITGRRPDGFHDLVSLVAPVQFGDDLEVTQAETEAYSLACDAPGVPTDDTNLVLRAAKLFRERTGWKQGAHFKLIKRVPAGAGLGGGSSDGTAALLALNTLAGNPLGSPDLADLAAKLGSDCVLFLHGSPCVMRGRGESISPVPADRANTLAGRRLLLFKPAFGINTAWAYRQMAASQPPVYIAREHAEQRLSAWLSGAAELHDLVFNNMETVAFQKYLALPTLLEELRARFSLPVGMSGSGSCCFALLRSETELSDVIDCIRNAWGPSAFTVETQIR